MLFNFYRLTITGSTFLLLSTFTCVYSESSKDLLYFKSLQADKLQAVTVNHLYVAPYYGYHNHDSGRFISYFHQLIHHKNHHVWWDTGLLLNGSTIGYRYLSEGRNLLIGSYLAYDWYGDYTLDNRSRSVYQMNLGAELSSVYLGQLTANFYALPVSSDASESLCGREGNWTQDPWIRRRAFKIVDDYGVSVKWVVRPVASPLQASVVLARSWIKQESVYHWDKGRVDRVGIGLQYLLGEFVHVDIQYMLRDAYQQGWRIGVKIGNMQAYREQNNLLGQLNRPPERHIPSYKTYQNTESAFAHNAPLKTKLFSNSGLGFGSIDSNIKRGVFDYFKAASADESSSRKLARGDESSVTSFSNHVRRSQSAGHASNQKYRKATNTEDNAFAAGINKKYAYVDSETDSDENNGLSRSKRVKKPSSKDKQRDNKSHHLSAEQKQARARNVSEPNRQKGKVHINSLAPDVQAQFKAYREGGATNKHFTDDYSARNNFHTESFNASSSKAPNANRQSASYFSQNDTPETQQFYRARSTDGAFKTTPDRLNTNNYLYTRYENRLDELPDGRIIASTEKIYYYPDGTIYKAELIDRYVASEPMQANSYYADQSGYKAASQNPNNSWGFYSSPNHYYRHASYTNYGDPSYGNNRPSARNETHGTTHEKYAGYNNQRSNTADSNSRYYSVPHDKKPNAEYDTNAKYRYSKRNYQSSSRNKEQFEEKDNDTTSKAALRERELKFAELTQQDVQIVKNCSIDELRKFYRKTSLRIHPDKQSGKSEAEIKAANEKFSQLAECYEVLSKQKQV